MSGIDELERAVRALRASANGTRVQRETIRARVLFAEARRKGARWRVVRWALPLAATVAFSSAWAASHGYLGRSWHALRKTLGTRGEVVVASGAPGHELDAVPLPPMVRAELAMSTIPEPTRPRLTIDELPLAPARPGAAASRPGGSPRTPSASRADAHHDTALSEADALYAAAHRAHFVNRDPIAAIDAWDDYLRVAPEGPLAPEARYNRALALVRVGRHLEASAALRPFAEGRYGGYRQREAAQIVQALDDRLEGDGRGDAPRHPRGHERP